MAALHAVLAVVVALTDLCLGDCNRQRRTGLVGLALVAIGLGLNGERCESDERGAETGNGEKRLHVSLLKKCGSDIDP